MKQKITKIIICAVALVLALSIFAGCNLVTKDVDKDIALVVATITLDAQSNEDGSMTYPAQKRNIYKSDLYTELNSNGQSLINGGASVESATETSLDNVIKKELQYMQIDRDLYFGRFEWSPQKEDDSGEMRTDHRYDNLLLKSVYSTIDGEIFRLTNEILVERNEDPRPDKNTDSSTPTFPVAPKETPDEPLPEFELYIPLEYPGSSEDGSGDISEQNSFASLEREAFRRFVNNLEKNLDDDFRVSDEQSKAYKKQFADIRISLAGDDKVEGYREAYYKLGNDLLDYKDNSILWYGIGKDGYRQLYNSLMQRTFGDEAKDGVSRARINKYYDDTVVTQKRVYDSDMDAYTSAADGGESLLLYNPTGDYYYVKHILIEFSDSQKAALEAIKNDSTSTESYLALRNQLVNGIKIHPIVDGEENTAITMSAKDVYNEVASIMKPLLGNGYEASRAFDTLIYKYNRDPGMFSKLDKGYLVKPEKNSDPDKDGLDPQWMSEFARAARNLKNEYDGKDGSSLTGKIGNIEYTVTDYGVHIVYLSDVTVGGRTLALNDYTTAAQSKKVYDVINDRLVSQDTSTLSSTWDSENVSIYLTSNSDAITKITKNYKDIWKNS